LATSASLGEAWRHAARFQRLWVDGEHLAYRLQPDALRIVFHPHGPPRPAHHQVAAALLYDHALSCARAGGPPSAVQRVRFRGRPPRNAGDYGLFGADVDFGAPVDEIVLCPSVAELPMPHAHAGMCAYFERAARRQLRAVGGGTSERDRVRTLVESQLQLGPIALDEAATRLRMSTRTLQRRLREQGTTLHDLHDEVRRERAVVLLDREVSIPEVSFRLGYSEPSAFHRAFRRWTGTSPGAFLQRRPSGS
jgi:AraC-like DNA-binding protein